MGSGATHNLLEENNNGENEYVKYDHSARTKGSIMHRPPSFRSRSGAAGADSCTKGGVEVEVQLQAAPRISVAINLLDAAPPPIRAYPMGPGLPASLGGLYSV